MSNSVSKVSKVKFTKQKVKEFLISIEDYLKEMKIEDGQVNIISLIEPIIEACQKMTKFSNCMELKGKLAIMAELSGEAMMVFLGMLTEVMTTGKLEPHNEDLLKKVMRRFNNVKFCPSR